MINPNELRLGNLIKQGIVRGIKEKSIVCEREDGQKFGFESKHVRPIPITHEILVRCGFEKMGRKSNIEYVQGSVSIKFDGKKVEWLDYSMPIAHEPIIYLHQLQNMVYVMTGHELKPSSFHQIAHGDKSSQGSTFPK